MRQAVCGVVILLLALGACSNSPSNGATTSMGGTSGGGTSAGGTTSTGGGATTQVKPATGQTFASMALAAAGGEAELFYAESAGTGGYVYDLRHLSLSGASMGSAVEVATGTPQTPPATAVSSDGTEVACCWEDYAPDPRAAMYGTTPTINVVLCNSVPIEGDATDLAMDGGFIDMGGKPQLATSSGATIVIYRGDRLGLTEERLFEPWGYGNGFGDLFVVTTSAVVAGTDGFEVFAGDGGQLTSTSVTLDLSTGPTEPVSVPNSGSGALATAESGASIGLLFQNGAVEAAVLNLDAGTNTMVATLSAAGDKPLPVLAASTCASGSFGFAYALPGGDVMFREVSVDGTPTTAASTVVANLGGSATGLALAPGDGGLLLAVGTPGRIAVYGVACP